MSRFLYALLILLLGLGFSFRLSSQTKTILPKNQQIKLIATLKKEPRIFENRQVLEIGDLQIYLDLFPKYQVGDRLKIEATFDSSGKAFSPKIEKVAHGASLGSKLASLRQQVLVNINGLLPSDEATLVAGSVLGVDRINKEFRDALVKTGTIHVVVVSGQNLAIVAGLFASLVKYLGRRSTLILATLAVFAYAVLTGFEPPVVRAALMVFATTLATIFGRQTSVLWNLFLAALIIIFFWPQALFEISFQLTFAATLGIVTLGQRLSGAWSKVPFLGENAAISTSAFVFTAPVILFYFGRISLISPIANLLVVEAVSPIMILGFLVSVASLIFMPLAQVLAYFAYVPALYFVKVVEILAGFGVGQMSFGKGNLAPLFGWYVLLFSLMWIWRPRSWIKNQKSY